MQSVINTTAATGMLHNGPVCTTCSARYLGAHTCSHADIVRRISELLALLNRSTAPTAVDRMRSCPCHPGNGGSGVCGCVLSGPQITC